MTDKKHPVKENKSTDYYELCKKLFTINKVLE